MDQTTPPITNPPSSGGGNKNAIWIVIVLIVLALIGWFVFGKKGNNQQTKSASENTMAENQAATNQPTSLKELMMGGPQKCTVAYGDASNQSQGTVLVAGGKMRGDFTATVQGKAQGSHMLNDGSNVYVWMDGQATGYKMSATATQSTQAQQQTNQQSIDQNAKYNYNCSSWSPSSSDFGLPAGVSFTDVNAMMGQTQASSSASTNMKTQQCAACNSLSGSQKAQCLSALACP